MYMKKKDGQIETLGSAAITLSALVGIPSIILLFCMLVGIGRQVQYGYSMYVVLLLFLGSVPSLLSVIFGIIAYSKYYKNSQFCQKSRKIALLALLLPMLSAALMILDLHLDIFIF